MRTGLAISCAGHAAVLLWSVLVLVARPYSAEPLKGVPVDVISASEFSQIASGAKDAPQTDTPKPVADKIADAAPVDDPTAKLAKKDVKGATDVPPVPKPPEPKVKKPPQPPAQVDQIADVLKKDEDKKPDPKKPDPKPATPPKKPAQQEPAPQFDPRSVRALLDKRDSQRVASAAGDQINNTASLGGPGVMRGVPTSSYGDPNGLTDSEKAALRARLHQVWNPPPGLSEHKGMSLTVEFQLRLDGTLSGPPIVLTHGDGPLFLAASDSVKRAVIQGQPYTMLRPEHYEAWKVVQAEFDPADSQFSGTN